MTMPVAGAAARAGGTRAAAGSRAGKAKTPGSRQYVGGKRVSAKSGSFDEPEIVEQSEKARRRAAGAPEWALDDDAVAAELEAQERMSVMEKNKAEGGTYKPSKKDPLAGSGGAAGRSGPPARSGRRTKSAIKTGAKRAALLQPRSGGTDVAGAVLAVFVWSWVLLPALRGGPEEVRNTLRAKFFNKGSDGEFLP